MKQQFHKKATSYNTEVEIMCFICNEVQGHLQNNNGTWICEECAQVMSEMGHELSL